MIHRVKENRRCSIPGAHVVVETATVPHGYGADGREQLHTLLSGQAIAWRFRDGSPRAETTLSFTAGGAFWDWLLARLDPRRSTWLWAHRLSYHLRVLRIAEVLLAGRLTLKDSRPDVVADAHARHSPGSHYTLCVTNPLSTILVCRDRAGAKLVMVDTLNWLPRPLSTLADWLGREQLGRPGDEATDEDIAAVTADDARIVRDVVNRLLAFVRANDCGNLRYTLAGQAFALWRHRCMPVPVTLNSDGPDKELCRQAYHGGRCVNRYVGWVLPAGNAKLRKFYGVNRHENCLEAGPVTRLDANACYPSVMRDRLYPIRHCRTLSGITPKRLAALMRHYGAVADCVVNVSGEPAPYRTADRVSWSVGRFRTALAGPELAELLAVGQVEEVLTVHLYQMADAFSCFVGTVLAGRQVAHAEGDRLAEALWKGLGATLHGKFGQQTPRWTLFPRRLAPCLWGIGYERDRATGALVTYRSIAGAFQQKDVPTETAESFPAIAAYTTSYARLHLRRLRELAGPTGWLYEDADSVHVTSEAFERIEAAGLIHPHRAGCFKVEERWQAVRYYAAKHYRADNVVVRSGRSASGAVGSDGRWHQSRVESLDAALNHAPLDGPIVTDAPFDAPPASPDGVVFADGWVAPFRRPC